MPLVALLLVALNIRADGPDTEKLKDLATLVTVIRGLSGAFIFWLVGGDLSKWVRATPSPRSRSSRITTTFTSRMPARRMGTAHRPFQ